MRKYRLYKTLRGKFIAITVILMLVISAGTTVFSYVMFSRNLKSNMIHTAETNLQFLSSEINGNLSNIMELSLWSRTNQDIINFLMASQQDANYATFTNKAYERLTEEYIGNPANGYISRLVIASNRNMGFLQKISGTQYSSDQNMAEMIRSLPYYEKLISAPDYVFDIGLQEDPFKTKPEKMIPIIRPVNHPYNSDIIGISFMQISFSMFTSPLSAFSRQEGVPVYLTMADTLYRIEGDSVTEQEPFSRTRSIATDEAVGPDTLVQKVEAEGQKDFEIVTVSLDAEGFSISVPVLSGSRKISQSGYFSILFSIILLVILIGVVLLTFLSRTVTLPVEMLKRQITEIARGDFSQNPEIEWDNEFGEIGRNINQLAVDIEKLMEQRLDLERQQKDYEYKMLQSQINPHFLYNTLNSIKWMAVAQQASGIAEMTTALAHLLKNISKGASSIVSVEDEIQFLDDYFTIQKYRYGGAITMEYRIEDESLLKNQILRFTLQPIAENAIFHGIEPKGQEGHIDIHIFRDGEEDMQIDITDDGVGMDEETIKQVFSSESSSRSKFFRQVGIGSVHKRIQYNYGEKYGIFIKSRQGEYTTVSVLLPILPIEAEENENEAVDCR